MQVLLGRLRIRVGEMARRALTSIQLSLRGRCADDPEGDGGNRDEYQMFGASMSHVTIAYARSGLNARSGLTLHPSPLTARVGRRISARSHGCEVLTSPREKVRTPGYRG